MRPSPLDGVAEIDYFILRAATVVENDTFQYGCTKAFIWVVFKHILYREA